MNQDWTTVVLRKPQTTTQKIVNPQKPQTVKIEQETEDFRHEKVSRELSLSIQKARTDKKWTRKDLAIKINEKESVITDYETGKAIPNGIILQKMSKALGITLRK
jgi:putative transcription factor